MLKRKSAGGKHRKGGLSLLAVLAGLIGYVVVRKKRNDDVAVVDDAAID